MCTNWDLRSPSYIYPPPPANHTMISAPFCSIFNKIMLHGCYLICMSLHATQIIRVNYCISHLLNHILKKQDLLKSFSDWHACFICHKSSDLHLQCYTCPNAVCDRCLPGVEFFQVKEQYGFCKSCLKLALLIEERKDYDSDGVWLS